MALTAESLIAPEGAIEPALFPEDRTRGELVSRISTYLADAVQRAAPVANNAIYDQAVTAWVYHRAYQARYLLLLTNPSSVSLSDQASASYTSSQIDAFRVMSERWRLMFEELVPVTTTLLTIKYPVISSVRPRRGVAIA